MNINVHVIDIYLFDKSLNVCFIWRYKLLNFLFQILYRREVSLYRTLYHIRRTINKLLYVKSLYLFGVDIKIFFAPQLIRMQESKNMRE